MDKVTYAPRVCFTEEEQNIILKNYSTMSAGRIVQLLYENDATKIYTDQQIYGFLRRVKREAYRNYQKLINSNSQEVAETLKQRIDNVIPDKRNTNKNVINAFINNLIPSESENIYV
jgi:hypothetical protein